MRLMIAAFLALMVALPARAEVEIQEVTSDGGLTAWLVEEPSIPFVSLEIRFRGGASLDLPGKRGATHLMTALLEEGAGELDARAFAQAAESIAATYSFDVGDDAVSVSARFLTETQDEAIALLQQALVAPRFDEDAIDRVRGQIISGIRSALKDPDEIVAAAFDAEIFGDHPYGTPFEGTEESVLALTRNDLVEAHQGVLTRDHLYVAAAGDISAEELADLMDRLFSDLPETGLPMPRHVEVETTAGVTVVPYDTPQSVAMFGHKGLERDDPDFFAAFVMNQILGAGGFESRLMTEVREKRGLTYGIYSYLVPKDFAELYVGRVASANDRIAEAINVVREEWTRLSQEGVTAEELDAAKTYLTGAYPLRFDGNGQIADILVGMQMDGLSMDYVRTRNDKVNAVTLEDIRRVADRMVRPDALRFVVVGQPEGLDAAIR